MAGIIRNTIEDYQDRYEAIVKALTSYLDWFDRHAETDVANAHKEEGTMSFPVYDSTLLAFVKQVQSSGMVDRNYAYVRTRRSLHTIEDELNWIEHAQLQDMDDLWGLLCGYVMEGMTRGSVWSDGVRYRIFHNIIKRMNDLLIMWSKEATAVR